MLFYTIQPSSSLRWRVFYSGVLFFVQRYNKNPIYANFFFILSKKMSALGINGYHKNCRLVQSRQSYPSELAY